MSYCEVFKEKTIFADTRIRTLAFRGDISGLVKWKIICFSTSDFQAKFFD